jgi:hypothetical protein
MCESSRRLTFIAVAPLIMALAVALSACAIPDPFVANYHTSSSASTAVPWPSVTDRGNDGFTMSYPPTWKANPAGLNDYIFMEPQTGTMVEVSVTTVAQSPATVLAQRQPTPDAMAKQHITVTQRTVAGHAAIDVNTPYYLVPTPLVHMPNSGYSAIDGGRFIVIAATNSAGTTNVYSFAIHYATDSQAHVSDASLAQKPMIDAMLSTFALPPTIDPVVTHP